MLDDLLNVILLKDRSQTHALIFHMRCHGSSPRPYAELSGSCLGEIPLQLSALRQFGLDEQTRGFVTRALDLFLTGQ